ncbi:uncharacterized protein LOC108595883 [Drosophila busckii]|uniref:uncharacterized protein LOC108595883 n=1 Tax=Drosophila busckii TaxID=30019 RepID=UPI00083ED824|nr:uncharacterized protein LOC108595883 [Drosophila busckii]
MKLLILTFILILALPQVYPTSPDGDQPVCKDGKCVCNHTHNYIYNPHTKSCVCPAFFEFAFGKCSSFGSIASGSKAELTGIDENGKRFCRMGYQWVEEREMCVLAPKQFRALKPAGETETQTDDPLSCPPWMPFDKHNHRCIPKTAVKTTGNEVQYINNQQVAKKLREHAKHKAASPDDAPQ